MENNKRPKLPLAQEEKQLLRKLNIKLSDFHKLEVDNITHCLGTSSERAKNLKGLATFQQIPSIGYELASKIVNLLGYYSLNQIKDKNWTEVFNALELKLGCWTDPCVEDQIICIIHHANHPKSNKQWYDFTSQRKLYRQRYGYPSSRPKAAWHEKA
ncbi:Pathogenicity locus [Cytobacillus firmus]|uniref:Uncharacterized protein n=1 Tax=Cytobacillus firmus TaxID=1399 RepID=A0A380XHH6_CYTFI|nr:MULTISPECIES: helix-hairpin-helix domain-containing protein [Bacillaceae]KAF0824770.1 hypothetical protein KIS1582_1347 [Cytobacillus firmus]MBG9544297.1 Pathogenicity locus [Cytobacillus firmus]MBG9554738.1 Pathogenicity locus [Cytobacillus firmus]MBG9559025.1 Pathogenicity locus [Cytobacillus firmus]MBG9574441.1 Pathogenicity locus [Cytobacillus firmus]